MARGKMKQPTKEEIALALVTVHDWWVHYDSALPPDEELEAMNAFVDRVKEKLGREAKA